MIQICELAAIEWEVWTTTARLVVTNRRDLEHAQSLVMARLADVDAAASRFRADSEVRRIAASPSTEHRVSPVLADLVKVALDAAAATSGAVDPTLGAAMIDLGYGNDGLAAAGSASNVAVHATRADWRDIDLDGNTLRLPAGTLLDLGATAKARTADLCALDVVAEFGGGALVSLGGDLRTAGSKPENGWNILVQDGDDQPASHIRLNGAGAVATSSTVRRTWRRNGQLHHHVVDPRTRLPADPFWRTASVAADTCLRANTLSTYTVVLGEQAPSMLADSAATARLVDATGTVRTVGGWPQ